MKNWIILLMAIAIGLHLSAQEKFYEEPIGWRGKNIRLHTIADREGQRQDRGNRGIL